MPLDTSSVTAPLPIGAGSVQHSATELNPTARVPKDMQRSLLQRWVMKVVDRLRRLAVRHHRLNRLIEVPIVESVHRSVPKDVTDVKVQASPSTSWQFRSTAGSAGR